MADNTTLNAGTGGDVIASDDIGGVKYQRVKIVHGLDGVADGDAAATTPLPVYPPSQTVTGTITAAGQAVTISDLKGASTVTLQGVATAMTTHTCAMEVLTASGVWQLASWIYNTGTSGAIGVPANIGGLSNGLASTSIRAVADVAGCVGVRFRSVTFAGTSFAVTMVTSYAPQTRIGPDVDPTTRGVSLLLINNNTPAVASPTSNASQAGSGLPVGALAASPSTVEVSSSARTATGNSGAIADVLGGAISATLNVTAASGTTPTLDLVMQESPDNGTTWVDVYHWERVTAVGVYTMPSVPLNGRRRFSWTIAGTTPSFTFSVSINRGGFANYPRLVQFFDRTAGLLAGTLNAVSATYQVAGCRAVVAAVTLGAATTPGTYKLQGSMDGTNWYDMATAVVSVANTTTPIISSGNIHARFARALVSSAGSSQTGTVVGIMGID